MNSDYAFAIKLLLLGGGFLLQWLFSWMGLSLAGSMGLTAAMILLVAYGRIRLGEPRHTAIVPVIIGTLTLAMAWGLFEPTIYSQDSVAIAKKISSTSFMNLYGFLPYLIYLAYLLEVREKRQAIRQEIRDAFAELGHAGVREARNSWNNLRRSEDPLPPLETLRSSNTGSTTAPIEASPIPSDTTVQVVKNKRKVILD